jgi:hypothetical protein
MRIFTFFGILLCVHVAGLRAAVSVDWEGNKVAGNFLATPLAPINGMARMRIDWVASGRVSATFWYDTGYYSVGSVPDVGWKERIFYQPNNPHDEFDSGFFIVQGPPGSTVDFIEEGKIRQYGATVDITQAVVQSTRRMAFPPSTAASTRAISQARASSVTSSTSWLTP